MNGRAIAVSALLVLSVLSLGGAGVAGAQSDASTQVDVFIGDLEGNGTEADPYVITNASELQAMEDDPQAHFELGSDIDASATATWNSDSGFDPVGGSTVGFSGSFDGNGYTITGLTIDRSGISNVGLFGAVNNGGNVANLTLTSVNVTGGQNTGGVAGESGLSVTFENITVTGNITGDTEVGGITGLADDGTLSDSDVTANVTGTENVGGVVGHNQGYEITNVSVDGNATGTGNNIGGLVGKNDGVVRTSRATVRVDGDISVGVVAGNNTGVINQSSSGGSATGRRFIGGLAGSMIGGGSVLDSHSSSDLFARVALGGAVGRLVDGRVYNTSSSGTLDGIGTDPSQNGGLVGINTNGTITDSTTNATVFGAGFTGGFVGYNINGGEIRNSSATGQVVGTDRVGGFAGYTKSGRINDSFTTANVIANNSVGGFVGYAEAGSIHRSFANGTVDGDDAVGGFAGTNQGAIYRSYAVGAVSGSSNVGGLVGTNTGPRTSGSGSVFESYWDTEATTQSTSVGGTGLTTAAMTDASARETMTNLTFGERWVAQSGTYPALIWQPVNGLPLAQNDSYSTDEDVPLSIDAGTGLLANDTDPDGDTLSASVVTAPANGTLQLDDDGGFTYDPAKDYNGADTVTYRAADGNGGNHTATVDITVRAVNDAPEATADSYTIAEDNTLSVSESNGVLANDTDVEGHTLSATQISDVSNGSLSFRTNGSFEYTPDANFSGSDTFSYEVSDGNGGTNTTTVTITVTPVNDPPAASNDSYTLDEDTVLSPSPSNGLLANDTDIDDSTLSAATASGPSNGSFVLSTDGSFTFEPEQNFAGSNSFTYTASDDDGASDSATVTLDVTPVNDVPVATSDSYTIAEDNTLSVSERNGVLADDTDVESDTLSAAVDAGPTNGTLDLATNGSFEYSPETNFAGTDSFSYNVSDGDGGVNTTTVTITVTQVNDLPVAANESYTLTEDNTLSVSERNGVLANDTDVETDALSASKVSAPSNGTLTLATNGSFEYTPEVNFDGTDSFSYEVADADGGTDTATVTLDVTPVNDVPVATSDSYTIAEDNTLSVSERNGVLADDTDVESDVLSASIDTGPTNGTLDLATNGSFEYSPETNFVGTDSFSYNVSDGDGGINTTTVTITVTQVNDAPVAVSDRYAVDEDTTLSVTATNGTLANDTDVEGDALSASRGTAPTNGTLTLAANGSFEYSPDANFDGTDSFSYEVADGNGGTDTATVTIAIRPINDAPVATNESYASAEDTTLSVTAANGTLANDIDVEGDALSASVTAGPDNGTLSLADNGSFEYSPERNFVGPDSFRYEVADGNRGTDTATVDIDVTQVNDPPVAADELYTTREDTTLSVTATNGTLANDTDVEGDALSVSVAAEPTNGTLSLADNGSFEYSPETNFVGGDSFSYEVTDGNGGNDTATVSLDVTQVNDPPVATNESYTLDEDTTLSVTAANGTLANDTDIEGDVLSASVTTAPTNGTLSLADNGGFEYSPETNFAGTDSFSYEVADGNGGNDTATVDLDVTQVNDPPVVANDSYTTREDTTLSVTATNGTLANDTDVESDVLSASLVAGPDNGTLDFATNGSFAYTPEVNFDGSDAFTYEVADGNGGNDTATVSLGVTPVDDAPVAANDSYTVDEDTTLSVTAANGTLANDTDIENRSLTASVATGPDNGTLSLAENGSFEYSPERNYYGSDSFTYEVSDGNSNDTASVSITVDGVRESGGGDNADETVPPSQRNPYGVEPDRRANGTVGPNASTMYFVGLDSLQSVEFGEPLSDGTITFAEYETLPQQAADPVRNQIDSENATTGVALLVPTWSTTAPSPTTATFTVDASGFDNSTEPAVFGENDDGGWEQLDVNSNVQDGEMIVTADIDSISSFALASVPSSQSAEDDDGTGGGVPPSNQSDTPETETDSGSDAGDDGDDGGSDAGDDGDDGGSDAGDDGGSDAGDDGDDGGSDAGDDDSEPPAGVMDPTDTDAPTTTGGDGPGFGVVVTVLALVLTVGARSRLDV